MKALRPAALLTALALLLLCLSGCEAEPQFTGGGARKGDTAAEDISAGDAASGTYFSDVWHDSVNYSDMEYEHYELNRLTAFTDPIYEMAKNGATQDEFVKADTALCDELYYIFTLYSLISITSYADAADEYASSETLYTLELYYDANDAYWAAMHVLSISPYSEIMDSCYGETIKKWFETYDPPPMRRRSFTAPKTVWCRNTTRS